MDEEDAVMSCEDEKCSEMTVDVEAEMMRAVEKEGDWVHLVSPPRLTDFEREEQGEWMVQVLDVRIVDVMPTVVEGDMCLKGKEFVHDLMDYQDEENQVRPVRSCIVLLFGVLKSGSSFLAKVHDFRPYLYVDIPEQIDKFSNALSEFLKVSKESILKKYVSKRNTYGWVPESREFPSKRKLHSYLQVFFPTLASYRKLTSLINSPDVQTETQAPFLGGNFFPRQKTEGALVVERYLHSLRWHEAQVCAETKFCDDISIVPSDWICVTAPLDEDRVSHCVVEVTCASSSILPAPKADLAPLLVAFFDIECVSGTMSFPDAENIADEIHQIGINFWRLGTAKEDVVQLLIVQPSGCGAVHDSHVIRCPDEASLLSTFRSVIMESDPDILSHYNGFGFDLPYLCARAKKLGVEDFLYMDRIVHRKCRASEKSLSSKGLGDNGIFLIDMFGRTNLDIFQWVKANVKLTSYKLDSVGEHFLGEKKLDMDYKELFRMACGSAAEMAYVGTYCLRDCYMLVLLVIHLQIFTSNIELSRVCHTPLEMLVTRGQQIKVVNLLNWFSHRQDAFDPATRDGGHILNTPEKYSGEEGDSYTGAFVLDANKGFHKKPVAVLDFMSLYPSIILANNFCFSTLVQDDRHLGVDGVNYVELVFEGKRYVWAKNHPGVIPVMMRSLLAARKEAKKKMKAAADVRDAITKTLSSSTSCSSEERERLTRELRETCIQVSVFDARQKALKVSANSVYGFTGALQNGKYRCLAVADCVTYMARTYLQQTVDMAVKFTRENFGEACDIVYGDTDSIMIKFSKGGETVDECGKMAEELAEWITGKFAEMTGTTDVVLEFEKIFYPWLLLGKKRYAGMMYEAGSTLKKLDAKGIELVRRDNCAFAKRMQQDVLDALMKERDPNLACEKIKEMMKLVVDDVVPIKDYIISKSLRKEYKTEDLPHVAVCKKMSRRNPGSEPRCGDRVPYVLTVVKNKADAKTFEKAEDPVYVSENASTCRVDRLYYVEHQVEKPIAALMQHVVANILDVFKPFKTKLMLQQTNQKTIESFLSSSSASGVCNLVGVKASENLAEAGSSRSETKDRGSGVIKQGQQEKLNFERSKPEGSRVLEGEMFKMSSLRPVQKRKKEKGKVGEASKKHGKKHA